jgi:hypothetical protein
MNRTTPLLLLAVAFCSSTLAAKTDEQEIRNTFDVKPGGTLRIEADIANVEITTGDRSSVEVQLKRRFRTSDPAEVQRLRDALGIEMRQRGNEVEVAVRLNDDREQSKRQLIELELEITMPREFNLAMRTGGSAAVGDLRGSVVARTSGGSLKLGNVTGTVNAESRGGSLAIRDVGGEVKAKSGGGSISIGRVTAPVTANAGGGSVSIKEARDFIDASAGGGSVAAALANQPQRDCRLIADAGNIELNLPADVKVKVDASCTAGRIRTNFGLTSEQDNSGATLRGEINGGGPAVTLRATAGNISINKQ